MNIEVSIQPETFRQGDRFGNVSVCEDGGFGGLVWPVYLIVVGSIVPDSLYLITPSFLCFYDYMCFLIQATIS